MDDELEVRNPAVLFDYIASWPPESIGLAAGAARDQILNTTSQLITAHFASQRTFPIGSRVVVLRCQ